MQTWIRISLCACLACISPSHAYQYVDDDNATGTEDGSAKHPYSSLQNAVDSAVTGEEIRVAAGRYQETILITDKALQLRGGYAGGNAAAYAAGNGGDFETRDIGLNDSHLQGHPENLVVTITLL